MTKVPKRELSEFDITVYDLWSTLRKQSIPDYFPKNEAWQVLEVCQKNLIESGQISFSIEKNSIGSYEKRHLDEYQNCQSVKDYIELGYFLIKLDCYSYESNLRISFDKENYPIVFVVKLLSYSDKQGLINDFLGHQFKVSFNRDASEFYSFLKTCIRQYSNILNQGLDEVLIEWIRKKGHKRFEEAFSKWNSFLLTGQTVNESFLKDHSADFLSVFDQLKSSRNPGYSFIQPNTPVQCYKNLLTNKIVDPKINWIGTLHELKIFIDLLVDQKKVVDPGNYKWPIVTKTFLHNSSSIKRDQLRKSNARHSRIAKLQEIVKAIPKV